MIKKQGNALFNFAVEYGIGRVNQNDLKLNGTHQIQIHVDYKFDVVLTVHRR
jgi:hypothetical protein